MHISVAPYPASGLVREAAMLKMSLLYADTVTLYSIAAPIYFGLADAANITDYEKKFEHFLRVRPLVGRQDMVDGERVIFNGYKRFLLREKRVRSDIAECERRGCEQISELWERLEKIEAGKKLAETYIDGEWAKVSGILSKISGRIRNPLRLDGFDKAARLGLLDVDKMGMNELDALEFILRSHNGLDLAGFFNAPSGRLADTIMQLLFSSNKSYPLLDTEIGEILRVRPEFEDVTVSKVQAQKAKHTGFASSLFEQLPTFTEITLDEILDIRKELGESLVAFRGAVAEYTELLESDVWDADFNVEADKVYEEKVKPTVETIKLRVEEQSALRSLARVSMTTIPALAMGALATGDEFLTSSFRSLVALGFTGFNVAIEVRERREKWNELKNEKVFFYYKMSEKYGK